MTDTTVLASFLGALAEIPVRLAALEQAETEAAAKLESVLAALPPALATVPEAAQAFKVSIPTMRRWVKRGEVPVVKIGNTVRVDLSRTRGHDAAEIARMAAEARSRCHLRAVPSP